MYQRTSSRPSQPLQQQQYLTNNNNQTPVVDPNDWARRMQEAKARAAEIRERRKGGNTSMYDPPSSTVEQQRSSTTMNNASYRPQQPQPPVQTQGPYDTYAHQSLQQQHSQSVNNNNINQQQRPNYRGMVVFPEQTTTTNAPPSVANDYSSNMYNNNTSNNNNYGQNINYNNYNNNTSNNNNNNNRNINQPPPPTNPPTGKSNQLQQEVEDTFYSMLRSDGTNNRNMGNTNKGNNNRRPQWNSDFSANNDLPSNNSMGDNNTNTNLPTNVPLSTKQKLALMRGELQQNDISPQVAKEYAGIAPPQSMGNNMKTTSPNAYNNGGSSGGGNSGGGGGTGLGDILGPKQQVVSRTGLKPTVIKKATAPAPAPVPVSYGNDDIPIGGGNRNVSYGNDDIPIGGGNRGNQSFDSFGPDSVPSSNAVMTSPVKRTMKPSVSHANDDMNDQNIPPVNTNSGGPGVRGKLSLLKSKIRTSSAKGSRSDSISSDNDNNMNYNNNDSSPDYHDQISQQQQSTGFTKSTSQRPNIRSAPATSRYSNNNNSNNSSYDDEDNNTPIYANNNNNQRRNIPQPSSRTPTVNYNNNNNNNFDDAPLHQKHSPIQEYNDASNDNDDDTELEPCDMCGRKFRPKALEVHSRVCAKVFQNKRKAFDVKSWTVPDEARAMAENKQYTNQPKAKSKKGVSFSANHNIENEPSVGPAKTKWEEKSSQLREAMKAARQYKQAVASGIDPASIPMPVSSTPDPSLIPCPNCGRSFNEQAAERHIPKCSSIKNKPTVLRKGAGIAAGANGRKSLSGNLPSSPPPQSSYNNNNNRNNNYLPDVPDIPLPTSMKNNNNRNALNNTNMRMSSANNNNNRYAMNNNSEDIPLPTTMNRMSMGGTMNNRTGNNNRASSGGYARY